MPKIIKIGYGLSKIIMSKTP